MKSADVETAAANANPSDFRQPLAFKISGRKFIRNIVLFFVFLEVLGMLLDYFFSFLNVTGLNPIRELCNITREDSLQTWIGVTQTFLVGLTIWFIVILLKKQGASIWRLVGWSFLALFFTYMSFDDGTYFHERMGTAFDDIFYTNATADEGQNLGNLLVDSFPSYYWQILYVPPLALTALFMMVFVWHEIRDFQALLLVCVALGLFVLAVGLDFVEGLSQDHPWNLWGLISSPGLDQTTNQLYGRSAFGTLLHFAKSLEETIEMLANTVLWSVFLSYLVNQVGSKFSIEFIKKQPIPNADEELGEANLANVNTAIGF